MEDATPLKQAGQDIANQLDALGYAEDDVAQEHHDTLVAEVTRLVELMQTVNSLASTEPVGPLDELALTIRGVQATQAFDQQVQVVAALVGMEYTPLGE